MNELTKELVRGLMEVDDTKIVALYGGGFKPPIRGHFNVVKQALAEYPEIDEFRIFVGGLERDGIDQTESLLIWDIYKNYLPHLIYLISLLIQLYLLLGHFHLQSNNFLYN